ncbi:MAG: hypothetical protein HGA45_21490, partial [Chloroflexales bacterium]|nr:hypothetical protein [Chloroflexales bacterium]
VFAAVESGKRIHVFADETRPLLQGARLNAWECVERGIPVSVLCDGASASLRACRTPDTLPRPAATRGAAQGRAARGAPGRNLRPA